MVGFIVFLSATFLLAASLAIAATVVGARPEARSAGPSSSHQPRP